MNILTFDIEDWFHILDNEDTKGFNQWKSFDSRIEIGLKKILDLLEEHEVSATFFILGWIAEKYPWVVKKVNERGYEIGSHTHYHQLIYSQNKNIFHNDVEKSVKILQDLTGKKVKYFRAPGFSLIDSTLWAFDVLSELKIEIDCSIFPSKRAHGGFPNFKESVPSIINYKNNKIKEMPINTTSFFGREYIFSGGGYFRLFPYWLIKKNTKKAKYVMTYFHPRDFDTEQPVVPGLSLSRKFKSYVGINRCEKKLIRWINDFDFIDIGKANKIIDWNKSPLINL